VASRSSVPTRRVGDLDWNVAKRPKPPRVPPLVADRVLARVAAHTGVDIPTLTTTSFPGMPAPPAVIHARLLTAALLKRTGPTSWNAIGEAINQDGNQLADRQHAYQAARHSQPRLAAELDQLKHAIESPRTRTPSAPATPHQQRMRQSQNRSTRAHPSCSPPPTERTSPAAPASPPAASTPTSPVPRSPRSTISPTPNRRSPTPPSPATAPPTPSSTADASNYSNAPNKPDAQPASSNANLTRALTAKPRDKTVRGMDHAPKP
jgi:hypothetical protein